MTEPLTREEFWSDFTVETDSRVFSYGYTCPRCGAMILDVDKHIEWHNAND